MHPDRMDSDVTMHNAYGEYSTRVSRASRSDSYPSTVLEIRNETLDPSPDYDVEGHNEKWFP
jgi:hypothetical protein